MENDVILRVENLVKHFPVTTNSWFRQKTSVVHAVDGVSFRLVPRRDARSRGGIRLRKIHAQDGRFSNCIVPRPGRFIWKAMTS